MNVIVLGAGHVGRAVVDALYEQHDLTVIDVDARRLAEFADRYDVRTVQGDGTTRKVVRKAGVEGADLLIACSPREEANLVCAILAKRISHVKTVVRTTSMELLEAWREGEIDVDFMVSPELETAQAIVGVVGLPAARQTDAFAEGRVQVVEFDVPADASEDELVGCPLRTAELPPDCKVASLIRGGRMVFPCGEERILPTDRVVVIASPESAHAWNDRLARERQTIDDIVIFGAGRMGTTIGGVLVGRGTRVRLVDADRERAHDAAEEMPDVRVFHASAFDSTFLARQRIGQAATVFCMNDDAKNLYGAVLAKEHGARLTIALAHDPSAVEVYERGGVDVAINPRQVTAEEMVRFAHDPRIHQIAMLEGDRFEILDITVRPDSELTGRPLDDLPATNSLVGAVIRDDKVIFPHGSDALQPGDRAILFVESARASAVERAL
jgi:trk system potassium uptake protein TrkA